MSEDWKDKPHWVLRFTHDGQWELTGPDGEVKHLDGVGCRDLDVCLAMQSPPEFWASGIFVMPKSR